MSTTGGGLPAMAIQLLQPYRVVVIG